MRVVRPLEQVSQRICGCLLPVGVQGQVGWGFEQPGLCGKLYNLRQNSTVS